MSNIIEKPQEVKQKNQAIIDQLDESQKQLFGPKLRQADYESKEYVFVFKSGGFQLITERQKFAFFALSSVPNKDGMTIDEEFVSFNSVARTLEKEEYYQQNPEDRPQREVNEGFDYDNIERSEAADSESKMEKLINGLNQYVENNDVSGSTKRMLKEKINSFKDKYGRKPKNLDTPNLYDYGLGLMSESEKQEMLNRDIVKMNEEGNLVITDPMGYSAYKEEKQVKAKQSDTSLEDMVDEDVEEMDMDEIEEEFT